ncbi:MAG: hypothetical protein J3K34DRAFT_525491 [Monoraphidium minutum]|nr:MAG: hypothetical protein J3K34DRAFT_525491 [Monoraphidium minutum]
MARHTAVLMLALVAFAGAANAARSLQQAEIRTEEKTVYRPRNPGEFVGMMLADILRGVARGRPDSLTPGPLPNPFAPRTSIDDDDGGFGGVTVGPSPEIEVSIEPELTIAPGLGLTPLALAPGLAFSATPLDLTLAGEVGVQGEVAPSTEVSSSTEVSGPDSSLTVEAAAGAAQAFKNALARAG